MPKIITKLVIQRRNKNRVNVFLDEDYAFSLSADLALNLRIGQSLDEDAIDQLLEEDAYRKGMEKAFRLLARRPRSENEITDALLRADFSPSICTRVIRRLKEMTYLDDRAFADWWIENRAQFNPRSRWALHQELSQKGVPGAIIEEALARVDDLQLAMTAAEKRAYRWQHLPPQEFETKMLRFLQRRGFSYAVARHTIEALRTAWEEDASPS